MKHHSATFTIAEQSGVSIWTVRRYLREQLRRDSVQWYTPAQVNINAAVQALQKGRELCHNHPRRHAPGLQLSLFD